MKIVKKSVIKKLNIKNYIYRILTTKQLKKDKMVEHALMYLKMEVNIIQGIHQTMQSINSDYIYNLSNNLDSIFKEYYDQ